MAKKNLTSEEFRRLQLVETELLVEFDRVCRKHDIPYIYDVFDYYIEAHPVPGYVKRSVG